LPAGYNVSFWTSQLYVAAITASSTSALRITQANGPLAFRGGGGSITPPTPALSFDVLAGGTTSSTVPGSGAYTIAAPSGLTSATWGGGCSGASTVTGFSASLGVWSATFSTPSLAGTGCTIAVTGTGGNTASATSPGVTITGASCSNSLDFSQACNSQYLGGII
jgi:hypothetical protein